jgi:hypothetical protein
MISYLTSGSPDSLVVLAFLGWYLYTRLVIPYQTKSYYASQGVVYFKGYWPILGNYVRHIS